MNLTTKLDPDFHIDTSEHATVLFYDDSGLIGSVVIDFCAGDERNQHKITSEIVNLPHYAQATCVPQASLMVDSHFDPDAEEPYSERTFEA